MSDEPAVPEAVVVHRSRLTANLIWVVPALAALVAAWLAVRAVRTRGPTVTISFRDAHGLVAGQTKVKYRDVEVGQVRAIGFSLDRSKVLVTAELTRNTESWMVEDTSFWIVEPRVTVGEISGLETLVSGAYIALDVGRSRSKRLAFDGLASGPVVPGGTPGRAYMARADRALRIGTPIYFRSLQVGQVTSSDVDAEGGHVSIGMFVTAPYDRFVTTGSRFWDASGIRGSIDANGARLETESLMTVLLGGISFEPSAGQADAPPAPSDHVFVIFPSRDEALRQPDGQGQDYRLVFHQSVRGLAVGAPVEFLGLPFGEVTGIGVDYDPQRFKFATFADVRVYPQRIRARMRPGIIGDAPESEQERVKGLVEHGLRAQLQLANLLTGQLYVAFDFFPHASRVAYDPKHSPREIPTTRSDTEDLRATLDTLARKLDRFPVEDIGRMVGDARHVLAKAGSALDDADGVVRLFKPTSARGADLDDAVHQIGRAARSVRSLADTIERHPESLIRGRK